MKTRPGQRNSCPTLSTPMMTGDGLLLRLSPLMAALSGTQLIRLANDAATYGNGEIEVTQRGNLQLRGFSINSAKIFATSVQDYIFQPVLPLVISLEPSRSTYPQPELHDLYIRLTNRLSSLAFELSPKCSAIIESKGAWGIRGMKADVRIRIVGKASWLGIGGDAHTARWFSASSCTRSRLMNAVINVLDLLSQHGRTVRGRDIRDSTELEHCLAESGFHPVGDEGLLDVMDEVSEMTADVPGNTEKRSADITREHARSVEPGMAGEDACILGVPWGSMNAGLMQALGEMCSSLGIHIWTLPQHLLLLVGKRAVEALALADSLGFITRADDTRLRIFACRGCPGCKSAHIDTRALASQVTDMLSYSHVYSPFEIHVSGCAKGCAHPDKAELCLVGKESSDLAVIYQGHTYDEPVSHVVNDPDLVQEKLRELLLKC